MSLPPEETKAMLLDPHGPKVRPLAYACMLPRLTTVAREYGYALAVHGSLQRDLDLIAVPWSEVAVPAEDLIFAIANSAGGFMFPHEKGIEKPHGRRAWVIHLGAGMYIDLSVMPRI